MMTASGTLPGSSLLRCQGSAGGDELKTALGSPAARGEEQMPWHRRAAAMLVVNAKSTLKPNVVCALAM
jgi:hypothetical protein